MKTISSWILGQIAPIRCDLHDALRKGQVLAAVGVITEHLGAEAIKVATGCRGIIDRVARIVGHEPRIEPRHAAATALRGARAERIRRVARPWMRPSPGRGRSDR